MPRSRKAEMNPTAPGYEEPKKDPFGLPMDDDRRKPADDDDVAPVGRNGKRSKDKTAEVEALRGKILGGEDEPEQGELFPELEKDNPDHQKLLKAAKKFYKDKAARETLLKENKQHVDGLMEKLLNLMHEAGIKKFRYGDITTEIIPSKEKALVKMDPAEDDAAESDDD